MDGEGSFSISRGTGKSKAGKPYPLYDLQVVASNTSIPLMNWFVERFGGYHRPNVTAISKKARANGQKSLKPCNRWIANTNDLKKWFIVGILPYLVIKKEQAHVALEFLELGRQSNPERRLALREKMLVLNQVGSPEANTLDAAASNSAVKIESDLHSDMQSGPVVIQEAA